MIKARIVRLTSRESIHLNFERIGRLSTAGPETTCSKGWDLVTLADNREVARWVGTMPHPYTEAAGRIGSAPRRVVVALRNDDRLIGGIGLDGSTGDAARSWASAIGATNTHEAAAAVVDYGFRALGHERIRAYTGPSNARSQKVLLHCGLRRVGEIALLTPTRHVGRYARHYSRIRNQDGVGEDSGSAA
ncbi:MAG TPA: GNAT family N-acetyltransferase [Stellaceae bacterium]|nr:GNAT family N-acetyltransferase [Stellaceae bacterium]